MTMADSTAGTMGGSSSSSGSSTAAESSSTGPGCVDGEEGCPCLEEEMCVDDLTCLEDVCTLVLCGNGVIDRDEECDDENRTDSDGCDNDCTVSAGAAQVIAGEEHTCALFHTGEIKCWGNFDDGRLGYFELDQDVGDDETPADMPFVDMGGAAVVQMSLGSNFTCALLDTDEVKCWGSGQHGRTGQASAADLGFDEVPGDIPAISLGGPAIEISAGDRHACAVMLGGDLRCWGRNDRGQVGVPDDGVIGMNIGDDELPSDVPPVNVGAAVDHVAAGGDHTCAILSGGEVRCFGRDNMGQLGTPEGPPAEIGDDEDPASAPVVLLAEQAVVIAAGFDHSCVGYVGGDVQCWGAGGSGRLGYGNTDDVGTNEDPILITPIDLGSAPTHLVAGDEHTCARVGTTQIYCWGEGTNGRLGYGNEMDLFAPNGIQVNLALPLAPGMVTAGGAFTCGRTEGSDVKCWGRNNRGQLGYGALWDTDLGVMENLDVVGAVILE